MSYGYYSRPRSVILKAGEIPPVHVPPLQPDRDEIVRSTRLPALRTTLHVTRACGYFLALESEFIPRLSRSKYAQSKHRVVRKVQEETEPVHRLCEYLSVLESRIQKRCSVASGVRIITPRDLVFRDFTSLGFSADHAALPFGSYPVSPMGDLILEPNCLHLPDLDGAVSEFNALIEASDADLHADYITLIAQYQLASALYCQIDMIGALVAGFTLCEALLRECWRRHAASVALDRIEVGLDGDASKVARRWVRGKKRGKAFRPDVAGLLAAAVQIGQIDADECEKIELARVARNEWIHGRLRPTIDQAENGIEGAASLIRKLFGIELTVPSGFSFASLDSSVP